MTQILLICTVFMSKDYADSFGVLRFRSSAFVSAQADLRARLMKGCLVLRSVFSVLCWLFGCANPQLTSY